MTQAITTYLVNDKFVPDHLVAISFTDTDRRSHSCVEKAHYCHALDILKAYIQLRSFDITERTRQIRCQNSRAFNETRIIIISAPIVGAVGC